MRSVFNKYWDTQYSTKQWKWMKIPFIIFWFFVSSNSLLISSDLLNPIGICTYFNCSFLLFNTTKIILLVLSFIFTLMYIFEKNMLISTLVLSVISIISFSLADSQGIFDRMDVLSGVLIAQFIAYLIFRLNGQFEKLEKNRIFYSQQILVALYFLSGLSKLFVSGLTWFQSTDGFALQIVKANMFKEINHPNHDFGLKAEVMSSFVIEHPFITTVLLAISLFIELFSFLIFFNKKMPFYYGVLLLFLHLGIWMFLSVILVGIVVSNLIFLLNIFYLLYLVKNHLTNKKLNI